jgi:hypothetical protein
LLKDENVFDTIESYYLDREGLMNNYFERFSRYYKILEKKGIENKLLTDKEAKFMSMVKVGLGYGPISLSYTAFIPTIKMLGTPE